MDKKTLDKRAILWYKSNNGCDGESSILNRLQRERDAVIRLTVVYEDRAWAAREISGAVMPALTA